MRLIRFSTITVVTIGLTLGATTTARAHCDGMDGPVVKAAQRALDAGDPAHVLIWVRPDAEPEVRRAFAQVLDARKAGGSARELADRYLFETVVRLHRAGEGEPFTGLKPAGRNRGPAIPVADAALATGSSVALRSLLEEVVQHGLSGRFAAVAEAKRRAAPGDLAAGRDYVAAYVRFLHYVEQVYADASATSDAHVTDDHKP